MNHTPGEIKYIFRDFGGVIASLKKAYFRHHIAKVYKISHKTAKEVFGSCCIRFRNGETTEEEVRKKMSHDVKKPIPSLKQKKTVFSTPARKNCTLRISIMRFIHRLQQLGYTSIMLSDQFKPCREEMKKAGWDKILDGEIISCEIGLSKYDDAKNNTTKIFDYALKKYKTQVSKVIFIDDTEHNCEVARKMGIKTILAKNARQIIKDAKKMLRIK